MKSPDIPQYELAPEARPVDAYINPVDYQVQRPPSGPRQTPQVKPITTVGQNSVGSYQGYNQAEQLAQSLAKFNPAVTEAMKTGGVMLAGKIMDDNEKAAIAAAQRAEALLDSQTQLSLKERQAAARKLTAQDPKAGWLMHALNPYREWGWKRGMTYSLGQKLKVELPKLAAQISPEDYLSGDQGMSKMVQLRSEKLNELKDLYGVDEGDPSFQSNVLQPFNKASDALTSQVVKDRVKWLDTNQPRVISNNVGQLLETALATGRVDIPQPDGSVVTMTRTPNNEYEFRVQLIDLADKLLAEHGEMAGLPGQRSKWTLEAYKDLLTRPVFGPRTTGRKLLDSLTSTVPAMGADGKQLVVNGQKRWLTLGEAYRDDALEVDNRMSRELYTQRQRLIQTQTDGAMGYVSEAVESMPQGKDRMDAALEALELWMQEPGNQQIYYDADGNLTGTGRVLRQQIRGKLLDVFSDESALQGQMRNPLAVTNWIQDFDRRVTTGAVGNKQEELQRLALASAQVPDAMQGVAYQQGYSRLKEYFDSISAMSKYPDLVGIRNDFIDQQIAKFYPGVPSDDVDVKASLLRQNLAYDKHITSAINQWTKDNEREPSPVEAKEIALQAMQDYGKNDEANRRYLFPASPAYADSLPSVSPENGGRPLSEQVDPPAGYEAQPEALPRYEIKDLDDFPLRRERVFKWREQAILSLPALDGLVRNLIEGGELPPQFLRFMRDARTKDAFQIIDTQLKFYPNYRPTWTQEEYDGVKKKLRTQAGLQANAAATGRLESLGLGRLAAINNWAYMA